MKILNKKSKNLKQKTKIEFLHDCILINDSILVFADFHIGYEEYIAEQGIFPRIQLKEIIEKLNGIFWDLSMRGIKIKEIIILGDLKHEFGEISDSEWNETLRLLDYLDEKISGSKEIDTKNNSIANKINKNKNINNKDRIILIKGNHDNILEPIARKRNIKLVDFYKINEICFLHGNKVYENCFEGSKIVFLGHLHPSITLSDMYKREKYKCFLKGKWKGKEIYVIPSFSPISFGYDLDSFSYDNEHNKEFFIISEEKLKCFNVIIYNNKDKKEHNFGKLGKLIKRF